MKIFGFELEFNRDIVRQRIETCIAHHDKGYACIVDGPSLARSYQNPAFLEVLHAAYFNSCDGGSIAQMSSRLYGENLRAYTGPEIVTDYLPRTSYRQLMLGGKEEMYNKVCAHMRDQGLSTDHFLYMPLPFAAVEDFDYETIAREIESLHVDIIWVSLGAPKQEFFMHRIQPRLHSGLMLGIGAAFGFYIGEFKDYSFRVGELRFNWIYRLFVEPHKQWHRVRTILTCYPIIYLKEKKRIRLSKRIEA